MVLSRLSYHMLYLKKNCFYDENEVVWNVIGDEFMYASEIAGLVITPKFGDADENSRLVSTDKEYVAQWNSKALLLSAVSNNADVSSLIVELEVIASIQASTESDKEHTYLQLISRSQVPSNTNDTMTFSVEGQAIKKALYSYEGSFERLGIIIVRAVATTTDIYGTKVTLATRTAKLSGILDKRDMTST